MDGLLAQPSLCSRGIEAKQSEKYAPKVRCDQDELLKIQDFQDCSALFDLIKTCGKQKDLHKGCRLHADILKRGSLENNIYVGNALLRMYAKCGALAEAQDVFDKLPARNVVSWTALITGFVGHGRDDEALNCFEQMQDEGISPDAVTFSCILKACGNVGASKKGKETHAEVCKQGLLENDIVLGNVLVDMYAKCGVLAEAQEVFDELPIRDVVSWTSLISGYAEHGMADKALNCLERMYDEGFSPDAITFICILKACGSVGAAQKGEEIHAELHKHGLHEDDIMVGNALIDMYGKCGALEKAQHVFNGLSAWDVVSWTALISGYAEHGRGDEAMSCLEQMQDNGFSPNAITFVCALKACGSIGIVEKGEEIHVEVSKQGLLEKNIVVGNALLDMYAKCGALLKAQELFDELPERDVVTWTVLISGYAEYGLGDKALKCFKQMRDEGLSPDSVTFVCILRACGSIGAAGKGEEIHAEVSKQELLVGDLVLGNALVDMYAKCGALSKAQEVFDTLPTRVVVTWTALMAGYAQIGKAERVFKSFSEMVRQHVEPDYVTFIILLTACSHSGLVEAGQMYFDAMSNVYCIIPTLEHHTCMVDLFSRAGYFGKAISVITKVPPSDRLLLWFVLIGACQKWLHVELGKWAFDHVIQLDKDYVEAYVSMCNIYVAVGMQEEADKVETLRRKNGAWKVPERCWWIDASRNVHSFPFGDKNHPQIKFIHAKLKDIGKMLILERYTSCSHWVMGDMLCSEKLAITCALINTPEGTPIRVTKNTRVCGDCHFTTSIISKLEKRKIQINDPNRIHIFEDGNGKCVCEE